MSWEWSWSRWDFEVIFLIEGEIAKFEVGVGVLILCLGSDYWIWRYMDSRLRRR